MRWILILVLAAAPILGGCGAADMPTVEATSSDAQPTPEPSPTPKMGPQQARRSGLRAVAALKQGEAAAALRLIRAGADVNVQDAIGDSVFLYAGAEGYVDVVKATLEHGAEVGDTNRFGGTALIPASEHAHLEVIQVLLAAGTPVNHVNDLGWTALQEAVVLGSGRGRSIEAVRLLLAGGADPMIRDRDGRTALENADRLGYAEIARLIRERTVP
jgi:ankyrin repeat protein